MTTVTVKSIPDELYQDLKAMAQANNRSINSEIIMCIERTVRHARIDPDDAILRARRLRGRTASVPITDEAFAAAKTAGRP